MSHAVKLTFFFVISVALHGAVLWAAAGHFEPHEPEPPAEVAIVDRDLFFRHAERSEIRASEPVSATDRLAPLAADAVRPSQPDERVASASPATASHSAPARHEAENASSTMARLDVATVDAAPPPRRQAAELEEADAERNAPTRMAGLAAALPRAAVSPRIEGAAPAALRPRTSEAMADIAPADEASSVIAPSLPSATNATRAARARAAEPEYATANRQVLALPANPAPVPTSTQVHARPAEPLARPAAEPATPGAIDVLAKADVGPAPTPALEQGESESARPIAAAEAARAPSPVTTAPAAAPMRAPAPGTVDVAARAETSHAPSPASPRGEPETARPVATAETAPASSPVTTAPAAAPARAPAPNAINIAARVEASRAPSPASPRGEPETARPVAAAEAPRARSPSPQASAGAPARAAVRGSITIGARRPADAPAMPDVARSESTDARSMAAAEPARTAREQGSLRGTLPAPLLAPRQPQGAETPDAPELADARRETSRLRPSLPGEPERPRTSAPAAQGQTAPRAERRAAPAPRAAPARPAESSRNLAAIAPEMPARRLRQSEEPPAGPNEPADRFTRAYEGGDCFFPLRVASRDGAAIRGYGLQAESVDMFRQAFSQALGTDPNVRWRPLTDAQCAGISFTRLVLGDTAPSVRIALDRKELDVGRELAGKVTGNSSDFVTLLLVDDSGVVHNVFDYLSPEGGDLSFAIPVQPVDDGTDRVQLIMAVGASQPLPALETTLPVHSDDFFPELLAQTREAGATLELGLEDFVILGDGN